MVRFSQPALTAARRPVWEPGKVGERSCDWSPAGYQTSDMFRDACFCIYHATAHNLMTSFGTQPQATAEITGCVGLLGGTMSVSVMMCKY